MEMEKRKRIILNHNNVDTTKQPMFFGEPLGLQRYDRFKYHEFYKLYSDHLSQFWRPNEIALDKDRVDYPNLSKSEEFVYTKNLQYQTMMDTVIARGAESFMDYVSLPELEAYMKAWAFFETVHSESYSYIIRNVYPDPTPILDQALEDEEILKRATSVEQEYDKLNDMTEGDKYTQVYLSMISVNILEAIRFYVSFVCSFSFAENKKMIGSSDIIQLIRRDENLHYRASQFIITLMHTREDEGFIDIAAKNKDVVIQMYIDAAKEEKSWAEYLFSEGPIIGLNAKILQGYIEWLTDTRLQAIGLPKQFGTKNPIGGWVDVYMNPASVQKAPQETDITAYKISATKNDLGELELDF
jgi:ribonucleoside-diphosphate reductase beta chain